MWMPGYFSAHLIPRRTVQLANLILEHIICHCSIMSRVDFERFTSHCPHAWRHYILAGNNSQHHREVSFTSFPVSLIFFPSVTFLFLYKLHACDNFPFADWPALERMFICRREKKNSEVKDCLKHASYYLVLVRFACNLLILTAQFGAWDEKKPQMLG